MQTIIFAGFWHRLGAILLDEIILILARLLLFALILLPFSFSGKFNFAELSLSTVGNYLFLLIIILSYLLNFWLTWLYFALMESSKYQATLGKLAFNLAVVDLNGNQITFDRATARYFCKMITQITLGVGWLMAAFSQKKQTLHDHICQTLVIKR